MSDRRESDGCWDVVPESGRLEVGGGSGSEFKLCWVVEEWNDRDDVQFVQVQVLVSSRKIMGLVFSADKYGIILLTFR